MHLQGCGGMWSAGRALGGRSGLVIFGVILSIPLLSPTVQAQDINAIMYPPTFKSVDQNGVDLISGKINFQNSKISVGTDDNGLSRGGWGIDDNDPNLLTLQITYGHEDGNVQNDKAFLLQVSGEGWSFETSANPDGNISNVSDQSAGSLDILGNNLQYVSKDGDIVIFQSDSCGSALCLLGGTRRLRPLSLTKPDGEVISFPSISAVYLYTTEPSVIYSNAGWMLKYDSSVPNYIRRTAVNTAVEPNYCNPASNSCSFANQWPSVLYYYPSGYMYKTATDNLSHSTSLVLQNAGSVDGPVCDAISGKLLSEGFGNYTFTTPAGLVANVTVDTAGRVRTYTSSAGTWAYAYSDNTGKAKNIISCGGTTVWNNDYMHTVTVTDPLGNVKVITSSTRYGRISLVTDELGRTIKYGWIGFSSVPVLFPEGNAINYGFDSRGNITSITNQPKPNSKLVPTSVTAGYDATCVYRVKCNKPNWVRDALGNETDYTYDNGTGLLLTVTSAANAAGVRPITANSYQQIATFSRNSAGGLSQTGAIWKLTAVATCQKTAGSVVVSGLTSALTCAGGQGDLTLTTTSYAGSLNALPTSVTTASGSGSLSATTSFAYDGYGDRIWVDGPRTDIDDKHYTMYDPLRRPVDEISPIPGGAGTQKRSVIRHQYDNDGREIETDQGYANNNAMDGSDAIFTSYTRKTYDAAGRLAKIETVGTGNAVP